MPRGYTKHGKKLGFQTGHEINKGKTSWNKGKKRPEFSEEWKKKIGDTQRGRKFSKEHCKNISKALKGKSRPKKAGRNNPNWKGGVSRVAARLRSVEWSNIRKRRLKIDKDRCQVCGVFKDCLDVHHIVPWRISHDDNIENLISVCKKCHRYLEKGWINE